MPDLNGLLVVVAVAFAVPFLLGLFPSVRVPSVVLEILAGIVLGPSVLGVVDLDQAVEVIALIGLGFVLFLAGLEVDFEMLRGTVLRLALTGFVLSLGCAVVIALGLAAAGLVQTPLLIAVILCSTALGVLVPVLADADELSSTFGQLVIAAGSVADVGAIVLLSRFFSGEAGAGSTAVLIGGLVAAAGCVYVLIRGAERSRAVRRDLMRLDDSSAQIRVRGALVLLIGFAALAEGLGLELILGAFVAGAILSLVDRDDQREHPSFRSKLDAIGFGFFIPVFFVSTGIAFDLDALLAEASSLAMVPVFLLALLAARGLPALTYRTALGNRRSLVAALMQATSLPLIVAATAIGVEGGLMDAAEQAALIAAGLISVLVFPTAALALLVGAPVRGA
jgi:Kef-type K+ transport system membrane component KefB